MHVNESPDAPLSIDIDTETSERLELLEHELAATRESLQATIEELETSNEELQATNEEMMASNEELQSSNEELQSVNEELNTVNAEYQEKIEILNRVNADLDNMARAVSAGTVFVDDKLQLTRFSPDAAQIFRLRDTDIGRPLEDLTHTLEYPALMDDLRHTLNSSRAMENDVMGPGQRHFMVRMLPYQIPSSSSRGVVLTFMDVTSLHDAARLQRILDSMSEHIAVLDTTGRILMVNAAWNRFAQANGDPNQRASSVGVNYSALRVRTGQQSPSAPQRSRHAGGARWRTGTFFHGVPLPLRHRRALVCDERYGTGRRPPRCGGEPRQHHELAHWTSRYNPRHTLNLAT